MSLIVPVLAGSCGDGTDGAGSSSKYYLVFDEAAEVAWNSIAFSDTGVAVALTPSGTLARVMADTATDIGAEYTPKFVGEPPNGHILLVHGGGFASTSDGTTWTDLGSEGLPNPAEVVDIAWDRASLWIVAKANVFTFDLHRTSDGLNFEKVTTLNFPEATPHPMAALALAGIDGSTIWASYHDFNTNPFYRSVDGGQSFDLIERGNEPITLARSDLARN